MLMRSGIGVGESADEITGALDQPAAVPGCGSTGVERTGGNPLGEREAEADGGDSMGGVATLGVLGVLGGPGGPAGKMVDVGSDV